MSNITWDDKDLQAALSQISAQMPNKLEGCVMKAGLAIEAEAKERCPKKEGTLRASITTDVKELDGKTVGLVGSSLEYAPYVHQGTGLYAKEGNGRKDVPWCYWDDLQQKLIWTSGQKPQPFLQEAADKVAPQIAEYFKGVLDDA